jgi:hypothetical protein
MALPATINVQLDFSTGATFGYPFVIGDTKYGILGTGTLASSTSPTLFADLTNQTRKIAIRRGRNVVRDTYEGGTATVTITDLNGDFNPQNPASPYYGFLTPLRKIRISADNNFLFSGYTIDYQYSYDQAENIGIVSINCADAFRLFNLAAVTTVTGQAAGQDTGTRLNKILDTIAFPSNMRTIDTGNSTCQADPATTRTGLAAIKNVEFSEQGAFYVNTSGTAIFKNRNNTIASGSGTPISFNQTGGIPYRNLKFAFDDKLIVNTAGVTRTGGTKQSYSDATSVATYFPHALDQTDLILETDTQALDLAKIYVATRKDTTIRIDEMTVDLQDPSVTTATILGMDYFTNVQISNIQPDNSVITKNLQIQGVAWDITPNSMVATFTTLERLTDGFVIGSSVYGVLGNDILSY